ncbi:MAG: cytochrome c biogenesis protein ResB [Candidatus Moduliflexus flocculans]|nr:cytochrome c biogenesis protein ResB [Candidatus Moduliflexus flocculans]
MIEFRRPEPPGRGRTHALRSWKFFSSVKLAIVLIILITLASVLGTLIPQGRTGGRLCRPLRRSGQAAVQTLQLTRLYQLRLVPGPPRPLRPEHSSSARSSASAPNGAGPSGRAPSADRPGPRGREGQERVSASPSRPPRPETGSPRAALRDARYRTTAFRRRRRAVLRARKRRLGHFGSDIVHLGLLVILAGGFDQRSRRPPGRDLALLEGETADVPERRLPRPPGQVRDRVLPAGRRQGLEEHGHRPRERRAGPDPGRRGQPPADPPRRLVLSDELRLGLAARRSLDLEVRKRGRRLVLEDRAPQASASARAVDDPDVTAVAVRQFVPDFVIGEGSKVQSRSQEPRNPAAFVEAWKGEERVFAGWIFAKFPDFGPGPPGAGQSPLAFVLKSYQAAPFSVLEAAQGPRRRASSGLGCLLVVAGLFLAFYWPPREITVVLEESQGKVEVTAAGHAAKAREAFAPNSTQIFEHIRRPT